jgi:hypothetical protein
MLQNKRGGTVCCLDGATYGHFIKKNNFVFRVTVNLRCIAIGRWYNSITVAILDIVLRPVFYLKHTVDNVPSSQEAHHVSATSPKG